MRRWVTLAAILLVAGAAVPARAGGTSGSVIVPVVGPGPVRTAYNAGIESNLIGVVFPVSALADGMKYTLTRTSGIGNLDAYFYTAGPGGTIGDLCTPVPSSPLALNEDTEEGWICPGTSQTVAFGIVILAWGANAGFTITW
jgi:hypothetical protein